MAGHASVDEYLAALPADKRSTLERVRAIIRAAAPEATETISYGMPAFRDHDRYLVWYAAYKDHCSLFPASGGVMRALGEELRPYVTGKGTIRFRADAPLPDDVVTRIVKVRLAETAAQSGR